MVKHGFMEAGSRRAEYKVLDTFDPDKGAERFIAKLKMDGDDEWTTLPRTGFEFESVDDALGAVRRFVEGA